MSFDVAKRPVSALNIEQVISSVTPDSDTQNLLLHVCCAPCASSVLEKLLPNFKITLLFYNPNIQPLDEYVKRAAEVENRLMKFVDETYNRYGEERVKLIVSDYCGDDFDAIASNYPDEQEGGGRCRKCFELRLEKTAQFAKSNGYEYFTTTLSVSPHKNAGVINEVGCGLMGVCGTDKVGSRFLCADFKKRGGYMRSVELSKELGLYRQNYCGCRRSKLR